MFPSFVCRYFYERDDQGNAIPTEGHFLVDYIREPLKHKKSDKICCRYSWDTKRLSRLDELDMPLEGRKGGDTPKNTSNSPLQAHSEAILTKEGEDSPDIIDITEQASSEEFLRVTGEGSE
jgi:hypothetical protein